MHKLLEVGGEIVDGKIDMIRHVILRYIRGEIFMYVGDSLLNFVFVFVGRRLLALMVEAVENKQRKNLIESAFYQHTLDGFAAEFRSLGVF